MYAFAVKPRPTEPLSSPCASLNVGRRGQHLPGCSPIEPGRPHERRIQCFTQWDPFRLLQVAFRLCYLNKNKELRVIANAGLRCVAFRLTQALTAKSIDGLVDCNARAHSTYHNALRGLLLRAH